MPELPEVETIVRELAPRLTGRKLRDPRIFKTDVLRGVSGRRLVRTLAGNRVCSVTRRAKHAVIELASGHRLVVQPGMTGSLIVYDRPLTADEARYVVLRAGIGRSATLVYDDVRRIGTIRLLDEPEWAAYSGRIGPEPLSELDAERLSARLRGTRQAIKKAIMDQRRVAGVGNIYANEALFRARIDPSRPAGRITVAEAGRLYQAIHAVLSEAIASEGTTFRDYRTGTGESGSFQFELEVYGRGGEPCTRCATRLAETHAIDARTTVFCWRRQGAEPSES